MLNSSELIELIFEIAGKEKEVIFQGEGREGHHYSMTPYRYTPKQAQKLIPDEFVDLGQGVLEIVEEIHDEANET